MIIIKKSTKRKFILFAVPVILICIIIISAVYSHNQKVKKANIIAGCTYTADGLETVADIECLNESLLVFKDANGKFGVIKPDGTITERAEQDKIYVLSDYWRNYRYVCEGPLSEYRLLIDVPNGTVSPKQYHGAEEPEKIPVWSIKDSAVVWKDANGAAGKAEPAELALADGLYPVSTGLDKPVKYGYINNYLSLSIPADYEDAKDFSCGLAAVKKGGLWGFINEKGDFAIPGEYSDAYSFRDNIAPVCKNGAWGIINKKGETVVDFRFENILQGESGKYPGKKDGKWYIITVDPDIFASENVTSEVQTETQSDTAGAAYIVKTSGSILNLRANPEPTAAILAKIPNGTAITVTESVPGWAKVTYNSATGWVSADYIEKAPADSSAQASTESVTETATGEF